MKQIQRIRPKFGFDDTLLGNNTGEFSFIPEEFVPHTVIACLVDSNTCEIVFEYPIDESCDYPKALDMGINYVVGKYTSKVIKINIDFNNFTDLITKTGVAAKLLETKSYMLAKNSYKKNYDLVSELLEKMAVNFSHDNQLKQMLS